MEHLDFVIWMIGYSFVIDIDTHLRFLRGEKKSDESSNLWLAVIWLVVGIALWIN